MRTSICFFLTAGTLLLSCFNLGPPMGSGPSGALFSYYHYGLSGSPEASQGTLKKGTSCVYNIFGLYAFGKGSIEDATRASGINTIHTVNRRNLSIPFFIYSQSCVVVTGVEGGAPEPPRPTPGPGQQQQQITGFNDTVVLRNGQVLNNVKVAVTPDSVIVTTRDGRTLVYPKSDVRSVRRGQ